MMKNTQIICYLLCLKKNNKEAITTYNFTKLFNRII